jgi:hypothetical protein
MFDECAYQEDLMLLSLADMRASGGHDSADELNNFLWQRYDIYKEYAARPMVTGTDLIEIGLTPDKSFSDILKKARRETLSGVAKSKIMANIKKE